MEHEEYGVSFAVTVAWVDGSWVVRAFEDDYRSLDTSVAAVRDLRSDAEDQLHQLPLAYFDGQPRGETLSRVTNDLDNLQHVYVSVL